MKLGVPFITKKNKFQFWIFIVFAALFALISLPNHFYYRTQWFDLGFYTNHCYHYMHLDVAHLKSALSDHFDLLLVVFSPLVYIFGTYTLLIIQIIFLLLGGYGIYLYNLQINENKHSAHLLQILFYSSFAVFSALSFDYHSSVIGVCLIPYIFYFYYTGNKKGFILSCILVLISKENLILTLGFILLVLPFIHKDKPALKKLSLAFSVFSFLFFLLVVAYIMPALSETTHYANFKYTTVGGSKTFTDVMFFIIKHPVETVELLFKNTSANPAWNYYKMEAHIYLLICGGFLMFIRPAYFIILLPVYIQKFLHDSENLWGLAFHYNIEFSVIIILMLAKFISERKTAKTQLIWLYSMLFINVILTVRLMDNTVSYIRRSTVRFYQESHYQSVYDRNEVNFMASKIEANASLSCQSMLTPHFCLRKDIKLYDGNNENAEYILLSDNYEPYPLSENEFNKKFKELLRSKNYKLTYAFKNLYLFKKQF